MLQREGFTDIHLMPSGFVIRAKDPSGNSVVMSVSPNSVTEISEVGPQAKAQVRPQVITTRNPARNSSP